VTPKGIRDVSFAREAALPIESGDSKRDEGFILYEFYTGMRGDAKRDTRCFFCKGGCASCRVGDSKRDEGFILYEF